MKIGKRIRNLRQLSSLAQGELAERAGLTKGFISPKVVDGQWLKC